MVNKEEFLRIMNGSVSEAMFTQLTCTSFFEAPASIHFHGAYSGGLYDHSLAVMNQLLLFTERLDLRWSRKESPHIVGMFHDLCKAEDYCFNKETKKWEHSLEKIIPGHGDKSVIWLQRFMPLTDEEIACIRWHMGAFDDKDNWTFYGRAVETFPNVLYTHTADMHASRVLGV
jgi:hypothetical protein